MKERRVNDGIFCVPGKKRPQKPPEIMHGDKMYVNYSTYLRNLVIWLIKIKKNSTQLRFNVDIKLQLRTSVWT